MILISIDSRLYIFKIFNKLYDFVVDLGMICDIIMIRGKNELMERKHNHVEGGYKRMSTLG